MAAPNLTVPALILKGPVVVLAPVINKLSVPAFVTWPVPDMTPDMRTPLTALIVIFADVVGTPFTGVCP